MKAMFRKNPLLTAGLIILVLVILLAVLVPVFSPYSYQAQDVDR